MEEFSPKVVEPCPICKDQIVGDLKNHLDEDHTNHFYLFHCKLCSIKWAVLARLFRVGA